MKSYTLKILYFFFGLCCRYYIYRTKPIIIGITGSVWKTSSRIVIAQILEKILTKTQVYTSSKNYNSELGLAFSLFCIEEYSPSIKNLFLISLKIVRESLFGRKKYDIFVLEYGIDHPGDMDILLSYIQPDYAIFTRLDFTHSDNFPWGKQQVWEEKWKLMKSAKRAIFYNQEDDFLRTQGEAFIGEKYSFFQGDIQVEEFGIQKQEWKILSFFQYKDIRFFTNLIGRENGVYIALGMSISEKISGKPLNKNSYDFSNMLLQPGRFTLFSSEKNIFIDSTYNAAPESMKTIIENTKELQKSAFPDYKLGFVLGDMREIGEERESAHRNIAPFVLWSSFVFTIWPNMKDFLLDELNKNNYTGEVYSTNSSRNLGTYLKSFIEKYNQEKYIVLFKGSQNTIFTEETLAVVLSPEERKKLPRQSNDWKQKKEEFFKTLP